MTSPSAGVGGRVACHPGVSVRSGAAMMSGAGLVRSPVKGAGLTGS